MAGSLKYPLCVEWTTKIPLEFTPRRSPDFSFQDSTWFLQLELTGSLHEGWFDIYLCNEGEDNFKEFQVKIVMERFSSTEKRTEEPSILCTFITVKLAPTLMWSKSTIEIQEKLPNILSYGKLTLVCEFHSTGTNDKKHVSTECHLTSFLCATVSDDLQSLSRDISRSLEDETFSDVKLECGDLTISAHRLILASRSEVFAAMFRSKILEKDTGVVDVQDVDPDILQLLLEYMYSGKRPDLCDNTARLLYEASDKYAVFDLKYACCEWMLGNQTQENCLDLLVYADKHFDENFKEVVVSFVAKHLPLLSIESWSAIKKDHPQLVFAVFEKRLADVLPCEDE